MTPNQVLTKIASILFDRSGYSVWTKEDGTKEKRKIAVRLGYGNRLKIPAGIDQGNCDKGMSGGFISLWLNTSDVECKAQSFEKLDELGGAIAQISEVLYEARITVHAQRCGSFDLLHRLRSEFCHPNNEIDFGDGICGTPEFGRILDVTALGDGDEFEDRAESVLTVRFIDRAAKELPCVSYCAREITKINEASQEEASCHQ